MTKPWVCVSTLEPYVSRTSSGVQAFSQSIQFRISLNSSCDTRSISYTFRFTASADVQLVMLSVNTEPSSNRTTATSDCSVSLSCLRLLTRVLTMSCRLTHPISSPVLWSESIDTWDSVSQSRQKHKFGRACNTYSRSKIARPTDKRGPP